MTNALHAEVGGLREKVERSERKTALAAREVGFLQALVVSLALLRACLGCL